MRYLVERYLRVEMRVVELKLMLVQRIVKGRSTNKVIRSSKIVIGRRCCWGRPPLSDGRESPPSSAVTIIILVRGSFALFPHGLVGLTATCHVDHDVLFIVCFCGCSHAKASLCEHKN